MMTTDEETPLLQVHQNPTLSSIKRSDQISTICILFTELFERLTYYSVTANLVLFATNILLYTSAQAVTISLIFSGTCYVIPMFGGWISDAIAGRFNTIYGSILLYIVGTTLLPLVAWNYFDVFGYDSSGRALHFPLGFQRGYFFVALVFIALGLGGIRANIAPFGAQQLEEQGPNAVVSFFNWFYWFMNLGSAIAYSLGAYIQQEVGFVAGYLIPEVAMFLGLFVFLVSRNIYKDITPGASVISEVFHITSQGLKNAVKRTDTVDLSEQSLSCIDRVKVGNGGRYDDQKVEGVKCIGRILPIFLCFILYWTVSSQMPNSYLLQGCRMNLQLGSFVLPAASLSLFNAVIILLFVPLIDKGLYPLLEHLGRKPTQLHRIGIGFLLSILSVMVAGILEILRKKDIAENGSIAQDVAGVVYNASDISILWQVPQFALIGSAEIFASIAGLEFAYSQSPEKLQGVIMGLFHVTMGLGSYLGSAVLNTVNAATYPDAWFPNEINDGYVEYFLFLLGLLGAVNFLIFLIVTHFYKYRTVQLISIEDQKESTSNMEIEKIDTSSDIEVCKSS